MLVFGVFAGLLSSTVVQTTRQARESGIRAVSAQRASTLMQQMTRDLRTAVRVGPAADATAFVRADSTRVDFYSSVTPNIVLRTLCVQAVCNTPLPSQPGIYRYGRQPDATSTYPELTYALNASTSRRLENDQVATAPLFRYEVRKPNATGTLVTTTGLSSVPTADLKYVAAVQVTVQLDGDGPGRLRPVELTSTVRPFNP